MKAFNPDKELKKIQRGNKKKIILFVISLLVVGIIGYSFALYQVRYSKRIIYTKVAPFSTSDLDLAIYVNGEIRKEAPSKEDGYVYTALLCDKNYAGSVTWDYDNKTLSLSQVQMPIPNKCNAYFIDEESKVVKEFNYTGDVQEYNIPKNGVYKIELWGASGGGGTLSSGVYPAGNGGYTAGIIELKNNDTLYFYVGEMGKKAVIGANNKSGTSFNGGGSGIGALDGDDGGGSGGGATDVRLVKGTTWDDFNSLKSRIMVAGGGGGASAVAHGGASYIVAGSGGGLTGVGDIFAFSNLNIGNSYNATQVNGYKYGIGEDGTAANDGGAGGGGGYYGGLAGTFEIHHGSGGGGSSFISGHLGCNAINGSSTDFENIEHTESPNHYSGKVFSNTIMIDGLGYYWTDTRKTYVGMPTFDGNGTMQGNKENGHAKITFLG